MPEMSAPREWSLSRWVESGFDGLYRRSKPRYVHVLLVLILVVVEVVNVPLQLLVVWPFLTGGYFDAASLVVALGLTAVVAWPLAVLIVTMRHRIGLRWLRGEPVDPTLVWNSWVGLPVTVAWIELGFWLGVVFPTSMVIVLSRHLAATTALLGLVADTLAFLGTYMFWVLAVEFALRPSVEDVASHLPPEFAGRPAWLSLRRRQIAGTLFIAVFTGAAVGGLSAGVQSLEARITVTIVATIGLAMTLSGLVAVLLSHSISSRFERLRNALAAVRAGKLDLRLPLLGPDELGVVGHEFNLMVDRLATSERETRASRVRIAAVADDERRRMERDLHDGAQQYLSLLKLQLASHERTLKRDPAKASREVVELLKSVELALEELRNLAHGIYPAALETGGLPPALEEAARRAALPTSVDCSGVGRFPREVEAAVYFCCLEALQNSGKHAGEGASATIALGARDERLTFSVADDGVGFDAESDGHGLINMRDRIGALGGDVSIRSAVGSGTTVTGWVPVT